MKAADKLRVLRSRDQSLRWIMRTIGLILVVASLFVVSRDITQATPAAFWFFSISAALGTLTIITSYMPGPKRTQLKESRVIQVARQRNMR